eukprot:gene15364-biopygen24406
MKDAVCVEVATCAVGGVACIGKAGSSKAAESIRVGERATSEEGATVGNDSPSEVRGAAPCIKLVAACALDVSLSQLVFVTLQLVLMKFYLLKQRELFEKRRV